jgi:transposase InsO family protein
MKAITDTLGVARSNVAERVKGLRQRRGPKTRPGDLELAAEIRRLVDQRPTYGYRRIAALIKRERRSDGGTPLNAKRVYRLMKKHGLLLTRYTGRRRPREHDGRVALNLEPCFTPVESPESNGMAEAFVKTFKRDYVRVNPIPDAATALAAVAGWVNDYNEVHPHSRLAYRSPREYIRASSQPIACPV